eukprot:730015-Heterocapsa_arctica.AAC.1
MACLRMVKSNNDYYYPTVVDNSVIYMFLPTERGKLASFRKGVRWAIMSSIRLWEPDRCSSLPAFDASDARWIGELHNHQL